MNRLCRFDILVFLIAFSLLPCISLGVVASVWAETNEEDLNPVLPRKDTEGGNTPDKALNFKKDDIQRWFERIQNFIKAQNTNRAQLFNSVLDLKVFQTNVFFGTALAVFLVLILLFFGKFLFNIIRDVFAAVFGKVASQVGRDTAPVQHISPMATSVAEKGVALPKAGSSRKFLFCDVMIQFVNPLIKQDFIRQALAEQNARNPKPRIGALLVEYQVASQQDVDKTLKLQNQYRIRK